MSIFASLPPDAQSWLISQGMRVGRLARGGDADAKLIVDAYTKAQATRSCDDLWRLLQAIKKFSMPVDRSEQTEKKMDAASHRCSDCAYHCQSGDEQGRIVCCYVGVVDSNPELCPVCGECSPVVGRTKDGRIYRECGDAHTYPDERKIGEE